MFFFNTYDPGSALSNWFLLQFGHRIARSRPLVKAEKSLVPCSRSSQDNREFEAENEIKAFFFFYSTFVNAETSAKKTLHAHAKSVAEMQNIRVVPALLHFLYSIMLMHSGLPDSLAALSPGQRRVNILLMETNILIRVNLRMPPPPPPPHPHPKEERTRGQVKLQVGRDIGHISSRYIAASAYKYMGDL